MFRNCILVTKPGIVLGNTVAAAGAFILASRGRTDWAALVPALVGVSLVVASACVFNNCIDRDTDRKMARTRGRVIATGRLSVRAAVGYGTLLGVCGEAVLWKVANPLCAGITLAGFVIYVGIYSLYLKRNSVYGALIGSLAGAAPPLAGYCAAVNRLDAGAFILFSIFSLWQMPHCYAIAILRSGDYAAAEIPVMPARLGIPRTRKHMAAYILAFTAAAFTLTFDGYTGYGYLGVAAALSLAWLTLVWTGSRTCDEQLWARKLYVLSILNIFALSVMMSVDATVPAARGMLATHGL